MIFCYGSLSRHFADEETLMNWVSNLPKYKQLPEALSIAGRAFSHPLVSQLWFFCPSVLDQVGYIVLDQVGYVQHQINPVPHLSLR